MGLGARLLRRNGSATPAANPTPAPPSSRTGAVHTSHPSLPDEAGTGANHAPSHTAPSHSSEPESTDKSLATPISALSSLHPSPSVLKSPRPSRLAALGLLRPARRRDGEDSAPPSPQQQPPSAPSALTTTPAPPLLPPLDLGFGPSARSGLHVSQSGAAESCSAPATHPRQRSPRSKHKRLSAMSSANDRADRAAKRLSRQLDLLTAPTRSTSPLETDEEQAADSDLFQGSDLLQAVLGLSFGGTDLPDGEAAEEASADPSSSPRPAQLRFTPAPSSMPRSQTFSPEPPHLHFDRPTGLASSTSTSMGLGRNLGSSLFASSTSLFDPNTPEARALGPRGTRCLLPEEAAELEKQAQREADEKRAVNQRMGKYYQGRSFWTMDKAQESDSDSDTRSEDDYGDENDEPTSMPMSLGNSPTGSPHGTRATLQPDPNYLMAASIQSPTLAGLSTPSKRALYNCTLLKVHPSLADAVLATNAFEVLRASLGGGRTRGSSPASPLQVKPGTLPGTPQTQASALPSRSPSMSHLPTALAKTAQGAGVVVVPSTGPLVYPRSMNPAKLLEGHESTLSSTRRLGVALARKRVMQRLIRPLSISHDVELGWFQRRYGSELIPSPLVAEAVAARRATPEALVKAPTPAESHQPLLPSQSESSSSSASSASSSGLAALRRWTARPSFAERNVVFLPYRPSLGGEIHVLPDGSIPSYAHHPIVPTQGSRHSQAHDKVKFGSVLFSERIAALAHVPAPPPPKGITIQLRKTARQREWRPGAPAHHHAPGQRAAPLTPAQQVSMEYAKAQAVRAEADKLQQKLSQRRPAPWSKVGHSHPSNGHLASPGPQRQQQQQGSVGLGIVSHTMPPGLSGVPASSPTSSSAPPGGYAAAYAAASLAVQAQAKEKSHGGVGVSSPTAHLTMSPTPGASLARSPSLATSPRMAQAQLSRPVSMQPGPRKRMSLSPSRASAAQERTKPVDQAEPMSKRQGPHSNKLPPSSFKPLASEGTNGPAAVPLSPTTAQGSRPGSRSGTRVDASPRSSEEGESRKPSRRHARQGSNVSQTSLGSVGSALPDPHSAEGLALEQKLQTLQATLLQQPSRPTRSTSLDVVRTGVGSLVSGSADTSVEHTWLESPFVDRTMDWSTSRGSSRSPSPLPNSHSGDTENWKTPRQSLSRQSSHRTRRAPSPGAVHIRASTAAQRGFSLSPNSPEEAPQRHRGRRVRASSANPGQRLNSRMGANLSAHDVHMPPVSSSASVAAGAGNEWGVLRSGTTGTRHGSNSATYMHASASYTDLSNMHSSSRRHGSAPTTPNQPTAQLPSTESGKESRRGSMLQPGPGRKPSHRSSHQPAPHVHSQPIGGMTWFPPHAPVPAGHGYSVVPIPGPVSPVGMGYISPGAGHYLGQDHYNQRH